MATITGFKFDTADGAGKMVDLLKDLSKQQLITLEDAATVTWPEGKKKPKTKHLDNMTGVGALGGAFWGMLFGLLFFVPFFGMAVGAVTGALAGLACSWLLSRQAHRRWPDLASTTRLNSLQVILVSSVFASLAQSMLFYA